MRPTVMLVRVCVGGEHRAEVGDFIAWASVWQVQNPDKISDLLQATMKGVVPAPVARNRAVQWARQKHADILMMLDDDMVPDPKAFPAMIEFLGKHRGPAVVGVPYCCGGPVEDVMCFEWASLGFGTVSDRWKLARIPREDAVRRKGIGRVANLGTGLIAYTMDCFDTYNPPYFAYSYNEDCTEVTETEDCYCARQLAMRGIPLHVDWDHWAGHCKRKIVPRPEVLDQKHIDSYYIGHAAANLRASLLLPSDVESARTDMAPVYFAAVHDAPNPARFVEVGCWKGASTILLANLIRQSGKQIQLTAVDTFRGSPDEPYHVRSVRQAGGSVRQEFEANLKRHNVTDLVTVMERESVQVATSFADDSLDFVYIDAQHSYEAVSADIKAWLPRVRSGGTLAGHDIDWPGVRKAVEELLPDFVIVGHSWTWKKRESSPVASPAKRRWFEGNGTLANEALATTPMP